jgi:hemolysin activation/secretion protein
MNYPFLQYEAIEDNYTTSFNLDQIHRTEDLHLGYTFHNSIGYADSAFGSDLDRFIVSGGFRDTLLYNEKILLQHAVNWHGIWNADEHSSEDIVLSYNIKYFRGQRKKRSFFAQFNTVWTHNLNSNEQIVLGGATGVRGFDNRMQVGDRRMVLTLEERQYTDYHVLNLAYLGFAVFVDLGRAWEPDVDDGLKNKLLADIGFGLRLASSKTDGGRVIHIDFAFPMTNRNEPDVDNFQLVIKVKNTL